MAIDQARRVLFKMVLRDASANASFALRIAARVFAAELVRRFDSVVASVRPDLVITHSAHDLHWDHGLVNRAAVSALRRTPCDLLAFLSSPEMNALSRAIGQCFADITDMIDVHAAPTPH